MTGAAWRRWGRAFTLIEMLVVISIMTLMIAMLMPSLGKSREAARSTQCLSNLKQLGLAIESYATDQGQYYPPYKTPFQDTPRAYWGGLLAAGRYITPGLPFDCPSFNPVRTDHLKAQPDNPERYWFYTQYGINWQHIGTRFGEQGAGAAGLGNAALGLGPPTPRIEDVRQPIKTIMLVDAYGKVWAGTSNDSGITFVGDSAASAATGSAHVRHGGGINVLFVDTHAEHILCSVPQNPYTPDALTDGDLSPDDNLWDIK